MPASPMVLLFNLDLMIDSQTISQTSLGTRVTSYVKGGTFQGDRLSGTVLSGGGDWATADNDGAFRIDARLGLQIDDGPAVHMAYHGRLTMPENGLARLAGGEWLDPDETYFRTAPLFEVEEGPYGWLNRIQAVAAGKLGPAAVNFEVYELR